MADADELQRGRDAAVECLRALQAIYTAAQEKHLGNHPDYRQYLLQLFRALRRGFDPIARCWPTLMGDLTRRQVPKTELNIAVSVWLYAAAAFFAVSRRTACRYLAVIAWDAWDANSDPRFDDVEEEAVGMGAIAPLIWLSIREALSDCEISDWDMAAKAVMDVPAERLRRGQDRQPPSQPISFAFNEISLPTERHDLELMLNELDEAITRLDGIGESYRQRSGLLAMWRRDLAQGAFIAKAAVKVIDKDRPVDLERWEVRGILGGREYVLHAHHWFTSQTRLCRLWDSGRNVSDADQAVSNITGMLQACDEIVIAVRGVLASVRTRRNDVLAKLAQVPKQPPGQSGDETETQRLLGNCEPCVRKAYIAYELAQKHLEDQETKVTDQAAYLWLKDNAPDEYTLPSKFENWARYVREARKALGKQINKHRAGRASRSVKSAAIPEPKPPKTPLTPEQIRRLAIERLRELVGDISIRLAEGHDPEELWKLVEDDLKVLGWEESAIGRIVDANNAEDLLAVVEALDRA